MNMCVEDYESKIQKMNNRAKDAYNALEDEKVALEGELNNLVHQVQLMQQQIESKDRYIMGIEQQASERAILSLENAKDGYIQKIA